MVSKRQNRSKRQSRWRILIEFREFLIQVAEGGFEGFAMVGVGRGGEIVEDAGTRQLQVFALLIPLNLLRRLWALGGFLLRSLRRLDLGFYVLAFPTTRHGAILTQIAPARLAD